jgi:hypothetical protein
MSGLAQGLILAAVLLLLFAISQYVQYRHRRRG